MTLDDVLASLRAVKIDSPMYEIVQEAVELFKRTNTARVVFESQPNEKSLRELFIILKTRERLKNERGLRLIGLSESVRNLASTERISHVRLILVNAGARTVSVWLDDGGDTVACIVQDN